MVAESSLFRSIKVGKAKLKHRIVLAPLTRFRADENYIPTDLQVEYYSQRTTDGGLLISEATPITFLAGGYPHVPGIYNKDQIQGWKKITDAVHAKGGVFYMQLWHMGRASDSALLDGHRPVSASAIAISGNHPLTGKPYEIPQPLTVDEIKAIVQDYAQAAKNAVAAGCDGVEIHSANGYLPDQFINSASNKRTDEYGGTIENRTRFTLEIVDAVTAAIGDERTAVRFSPWSEFQDVRDDTPYETWGYMIDRLQKRHPNLAYIHMIEPRDDFSRTTKNDTVNSLDPFRAIWKGPFISAGGYTTHPDLAAKVADETGNLIAIGRAFIANPDIVERMKNGWPLTKYNRDTFYTPGPVGYTDYPTYETEA
ncbi:hypothetical protein BX666DRAFT_1933769 [Dichotomocladium elegans]|nr:hypothetical protein BX666DRAFT_1933769 [Dichotomocladium elegans]